MACMTIKFVPAFLQMGPALHCFSLLKISMQTIKYILLLKEPNYARVGKHDEKLQ